jgi:hypothetical protein
MFDFDHSEAEVIFENEHNIKAFIGLRRRTYNLWIGRTFWENRRADIFEELDQGTFGCF